MHYEDVEDKVVDRELQDVILGIVAYARALKWKITVKTFM